MTADQALRRLLHQTAVIVLLCFAVTAHATSVAPKAGIVSNVLVANGKVFFCQPDFSLTILDLATGGLLVRDPDVTCESRFSFSATGYGVMLSSESWFRMIDLPRTLASGKLAVAWQVGSKFGACRRSLLTGKHLVCNHLNSQVVELRSLTDGSVLWTYDARGQVHDILEGKGRLLFLVDVSVPIPGTVIRPVLEVALVSLSSGQELVRQPITRDGFLARMLARLNLWIQGDGDAHFAVRSFDGDSIVMEARPPEGHSCQGVLLKTLRLSPPEKGLSNRDTCEHPKGAPALAAALGQDCRGSPSEGYVCDLSQLRRAPSGSNPRPIALKLGSDSLTLTWTGEGVLLEQSSSRGRWSAFDRQQHAAPLKRIWGMEGAVFLERESSDTGILECLAFDSGQPRWSYDFPTSR